MTEENTKYEVAQVAEPQSTPDAMHFMMEMASRNITPENIEKMMELKERDERNQARKAFYEAMANFKANQEMIVKDKKVEFGNTSYSHSSLAHTLSGINENMSKNGLSVSWRQKQEGSSITVMCVVSHRLGHSESTSLSSAADSSGKKNSIQAIGSTVKYLERYTLYAILGLADKDHEDDGRGSEPPKFLYGKKLSEIYDLIEAKIIDRNNYLAYCQGNHGVGSSFDEIPDREYQAMRADLASMPDKVVSK